MIDHKLNYENAIYHSMVTETVDSNEIRRKVQVPSKLKGSNVDKSIIHEKKTLILLLKPVLHL